MELPREWAQMDADQLRDLTASLFEQLQQQETQLAEQDAQISERDGELHARDAQLAHRDEELKRKQLKIDQLTHEIATLNRWRYAKRSEQLDAVQRSLLDESIDADIEAISLEIESLQEKSPSGPKAHPRRVALPAGFPRREIRHEPEQTQCSCGCRLERIGEDISEKLDYLPGVFHVERHIRGKWVCRGCERLIQAPVAPYIIDKGIPTAGLLAQVLIAKYLDHAPLYRQEQIFGRAGLALPRSTLAQWVGACGLGLQPLTAALRAALLSRPVLHADETPVPAAQYLEPEEIKQIIAQPVRSSISGCRDHALLLFLYNTGARVSEALGVRREHLSLNTPRHVRLFGKGSKERICPLWRDTASALQRLLDARHAQPRDWIFCNHAGSPLSRDGVAYILKKYSMSAAHAIPALRRRRVTPHMFRHSCAVALLQAGVDITVIRDYLGHASISTTSRYVSTNLQMKRNALEHFWQRSGLSPTRARPWSPKPDLLAYLSSL